MMTQRAQGPLIETLRIPSANGTYVELRQDRHGDRITYAVEHGDHFGHRGTWGRDNYADAVTTASSAWTWNMGIKEKGS
jgi:hypothetical protein